VSSVRAALKFDSLPRPIIVMHVRRGDKGDELASPTPSMGAGTVDGTGDNSGTKKMQWGEWGHEQVGRLRVLGALVTCNSSRCMQCC
jgi:hypothetical protein